jgi:hypothetical protein
VRNALEDVSGASVATLIAVAIAYLVSTLGVHGDGALGIGAGTAVTLIVASQVVLRRYRHEFRATTHGEEPNLLENEVRGLDHELVAGWELLERCDDDHAWECSPNATTETEVDDWERRVLLLLPQDFAIEYRRAGPAVHAPGNPISDLAKRLQGKLEVLYNALMSRRQYFHHVAPDAVLTPDRPYPYPGYVG